MIINSFVGLLSFSLPLLGNSLVYGSSVLPEENLYRERRDMYGGGGGYGGGYGGGSYGCSCPYASCDNKSDGLLAFGVGALLGLFLSMLRTMMMTTTTTTNTGGNGGRIRRDTLADFQKNVTWADESARFNSQHRSTLTKLLHLPESFSDDVVPMVADLLQIYTDSGKRPECVRRWVCEATQQSIKMGGLRARLGSLSSIAFGWYTKDLGPIIHNMISGSQDLDCKYLSPKCELPFGHGPDVPKESKNKS